MIVIMTRAMHLGRLMAPRATTCTCVSMRGLLHCMLQGAGAEFWIRNASAPSAAAAAAAGAAAAAHTDGDVAPMDVGVGDAAADRATAKAAPAGAGIWKSGLEELSVRVAHAWHECKRARSVALHARTHTRANHDRTHLHARAHHGTD